jgi:UDP-N-acetylmuramoyl-tripeptide--D-alanyl-D-alanine ligase
MIRRTLGEVAVLAGGTLAGVPDDGRPLSGAVVADSRLVEAGGLFVAITGGRVDGHDFAAGAAGAGVAAVLASRPVDAPAIMVDDTVLALGHLAHGYLDELRRSGELLVASITGSSGKTSTKDLLAQVLASCGDTVAPVGSFNTEVGLPLTVLAADERTRFLVLEASSRGIGHIAYLCEIARPDVAVVLNVGAAHLGEFGSREAVARAKGELVEALEPAGLAVLNADDPAVAAMSTRTRARIRTFGEHADADVRATDIALDSLARPLFRVHAGVESAVVQLALHGRHQVWNALAVTAVALDAGLSLAEIAGALSAARPVSRWRMEVTTTPDGVVVINDAYNANPESMRVALDALVATTTPRAGRRFAVLGRMAELGDETAHAHDALGASVAAAGIDRLVVVGPDVAAIATGALRAGLAPEQVTEVADAAAAVHILAAELATGDVVLIKASRSADLQQIAQSLLAAGVPA